MRVTLKEDIIISISLSGIEVGDPPRGVGIERLRFTGSNLVDLANLSTIWVRPISTVGFELHAIQVPGSQSVVMSYSDRKKLVNENGSIRVLTAQEQIDKLEADNNDAKDNRDLKDEIRQLVADLTYNKIDQHIENVFGALTANQKSSLKRLYKVVLFLAKKQQR